MPENDIYKKYEALKEEFQNYAYIVSHDLNAPVRHIKEFTRLMLEDLAPHIDGEVLEYKKFINESVYSIEKKLSALLKYSRANTSKINNVEIDTEEFIQNSALEVMAVRPFKVSYSGNFPSIFIDPEMFSHIFRHLLDNASKFTKADGEVQITVNCETQNDYIIFTVGDNGIGIPENKFKEIFELFRKLTLDYEGEGVGLTVAQQMLRRFEGFIEVESEINQGSKFRVYLPSSLIAESIK